MTAEMNDEVVSLGVPFVEAELSMLATLVTLAISGAALRSAYRLLAHCSRTTYVWCRRWALIASGALLAWYGLEGSISLARELPILLAIVAADCWLVAWISGPGPGPSLPTACVRRRARTA